MRHPIGDLVDRVRDALSFHGHRRGHERVLLLDDADDFESRTPVDVETGVEPVLTHSLHDIITQTCPP